MRLAFCGPSGAGKSEACKYLTRKHGGVTLSFASKLKEDAFDYGWDGKKDERGRKFLQSLGQCVRAYNPDYWANNVRAQIEHGYAGEMNENIYIDDLRFLNEVDILRSLGFKIVYLKPHGLPDADAEWRKDASEQLPSTHADMIIRSDIGLVSDLYRTLDAVVDELFNGDI